MTLDDFIEMLAEINGLSDLNENNIIERIKTKLEENDLRRWENSGFDIDHIFTTHSDPVPVEVTLLHFAAKCDYENIVRALIALGADVNTQDNDGWTPSNYADREGHEDIARFLLENGANFEPRAEMEVESAEQVAPAEKLELGMFKKVCQTAFLVQLNFQSIWKENIKLRHS